MSICINCQVRTPHVSCATCPDGGDVRTEEYNKGYLRGVAEGKRLDREKLKAQDRGYIASSNDGISRQGTGAHWAFWLEGQDKKT
jgi:hypothetical protein